MDSKVFAHTININSIKFIILLIITVIICSHARPWYDPFLCTAEVTNYFPNKILISCKIVGNLVLGIEKGQKQILRFHLTPLNMFASESEYNCKIQTPSNKIYTFPAFHGDDACNLVDCKWRVQEPLPSFYAPLTRRWEEILWGTDGNNEKLWG